MPSEGVDDRDEARSPAAPPRENRRFPDPGQGDQFRRRRGFRRRNPALLDAGGDVARNRVAGFVLPPQAIIQELQDRSLELRQPAARRPGGVFALDTLGPGLGLKDVDYAGLVGEGDESSVLGARGLEGPLPPDVQRRFELPPAPQIHPPHATKPFEYERDPGLGGQGAGGRDRKVVRRDDFDPARGILLESRQPFGSGPDPRGHRGVRRQPFLAPTPDRRCSLQMAQPEQQVMTALEALRVPDQKRVPLLQLAPQAREGRRLWRPKRHSPQPFRLHDGIPAADGCQEIVSAPGRLRVVPAPRAIRHDAEVPLRANPMPGGPRGPAQPAGRPEARRVA
jgi:hypothetical protein